MDSNITSFSDIYQLLDRWQPSTKKSRHGLEHMFKLMNALGDPQQRLKVIHVAGTSGKTSTSYYIASLLSASGYKVGLTISPHVDQINERVQVGLTPLSEKEFTKSFSQFLPMVEASGIIPNYFELFIAFAFWEFDKRNLDYVVIETGIGGLLDSTNVCVREDKVCVITDIDFDHQDILGDTLAEIAAQKAGIIQLHNTVFCYRQSDEVMQQIQSAATNKQATLNTFGPEIQASQMDRLPLFQQRNLGLAIQAINDVLSKNNGSKLTDRAIAKGAGVHIPARMETVQIGSKTVIVDCAHNAQKLKVLGQSLKHAYPGRSVAAIVGFGNRKDYLSKNKTKELGNYLDHIIITRFTKEDNAKVLAALFNEHGVLSVQVVSEVDQAVKTLLARPEDILLVTGSFFLLNEVRPILGIGRSA